MQVYLDATFKQHFLLFIFFIAEEIILKQISIKGSSLALFERTEDCSRPAVCC